MKSQQLRWVALFLITCPVIYFGLGFLDKQNQMLYRIVTALIIAGGAPTVAILISRRNGRR